MEEKQLPRGLRNNNPLNIRKGQNWQGLDNPPDDGAFCRFVNMVMGFRAAFKILHTYYYKYKLTTTRDIIGRWAPEADGNDTKRYARFVAGAIGRTPRQFIPYLEEFRWEWVQIVVAMAQVENGVNNVDAVMMEYYAEQAWDLLFKNKERDGA